MQLRFFQRVRGFADLLLARKEHECIAANSTGAVVQLAYRLDDAFGQRELKLRDAIAQRSDP